MHLSTLTLRNVRQFEHRTFRFSLGFNLLVGENGAGKTTILRSLLATIGDPQSGASRQRLEDEDIRLRTELAIVDATVIYPGGHREEFHLKKPLWGRRVRRLPQRSDRPLVLSYASNEATCQSMRGKRTALIRGGEYDDIRRNEEFLFYGAQRAFPYEQREDDAQRFGNSQPVQGFVGKVLTTFSPEFKEFYWRFEPYNCQLIPPENLSKEQRLDEKAQKKARAAAMRLFQEEHLQMSSGFPDWPDQPEVVLGSSGKSSFAEMMGRELYQVWDKLDLPIETKQILRKSMLKVKLTPRIMIRRSMGPLSLSQLSDGEQRLFSLFVDIARALSLQEHGVWNLCSDRAIVLIDEIDVHLHPKWQRKIVPALEDLFPDCQFIATTHSPFVIQSVRSESNLLLLDGHPLDQLGNTGIEEISQVVMDVDRPDVSDRYVSEVELAKSFLQLLDEAEKTPKEKLEVYVNRLRQKLDHAQNPAMQAFLELQQESRLGD